MYAIFDIIAWISAAALVFRLRKYFLPADNRYRMARQERTVSIIIAARNEARNLPALLRSLDKLDIRPNEVIVVDDNSTDDTAVIAANAGAKVFSAGKRPEGWVGKTWACHVGALHATGEMFLFSDADTTLTPDSLTHALAYLEHTGSQMLSAPSFHRSELWWERFLGPFHCIIHCGASPLDRQTAERTYAVGQYILVNAEAYRACGGHMAVRSAIAEDTGLAKTIIANGGRYVLFTEKPLYSVQMYSSFGTFCKGWLRLLRVGMQELSFEISLKSVLPLLALNLWNLFPPTFFSYVPVGVTLVCFAVVQRRIGKFSVLGLVFFPLSVAMFVLLSCRAVISEFLARPIKWKGRIYQNVTE